MIDLIHGDCLEVMKDIPDGSIDMILCDLPYGVTQNSKDIVIPYEELWSNYKRVIKEHGVIALFAQGKFYINLVNSNLQMFKYDLIWDKQLVSGFLNSNKMPLRKHEQIAVFYKKLPTYNPQFTYGKPLHSRGTKYISQGLTNNNYGNYKVMESEKTEKKYPTSILSIQKPHPSTTIHPTQKPVELLEYLIKTYTNEGDMVLDNCMGSGSTGVACVNTNRNFIGIELDENYFNIAKKRIEKAQGEVAQ